MAILGLGRSSAQRRGQRLGLILGSHRVQLLVWLSARFLAVSATVAVPASESAGGQYVALNRMDSKRLMMRVPAGAPLPSLDEEVMLDELEHWKWSVEIAAADAAILATSSQCPHGLGLLPSALGWSGGGQWRPWPGTFEYGKGSLVEGGTAKWKAVSDTLACEGEKGVKVLKQMQNMELATCQEACVGHQGCKAIDYFRKTQWCNLFDKACAKPSRTHDGASSWKLDSSGKNSKVLKVGSFSFLAAKQWCQSEAACRGFSYSGAWPDKEREGGVPRTVYFSKAELRQDGKGSVKWNTYLRRDNPRANCNPEGPQFECPNNAYACLGLSIDADETSIKQAYRTMSKRMHPDKVSDRTPQAVKEAEAAFRQISEAHEALRDPRERRRIDQKLRGQRRKWEEQRASMADLYIKEPWVTSLEPESYPVLIPKGQEWLVHFFLPDHDDCKQMKMALSRAATELGTGEEDRGLPQKREPQVQASFKKGNIFWGTIRERSTGLRNEGASAQEGDTHVAMVILAETRAKLYFAGEEMEVLVRRAPAEADQKPRFMVSGSERTFTGSFDAYPEWFRGIVTETANPKNEVASFAIRLDTWRDTSGSVEGFRKKPRLFGAVNCGRFPDFCKRKGADPKVVKRFPQVRMLFPDEVRYEVYTGKGLGKAVVAFAREASRPQGAVRRLDAEAWATITYPHAARELWLLLLLHEPAGKAVLDCELCRTVLPMLRRTAPRLQEARVNAGWVNCSAEEELCTELELGYEESKAEWGLFIFREFGGGSDRSMELWDPALQMGPVGRQALLASLEGAARFAEFRSGSALASNEHAQTTAHQKPREAEL